MYLLKNGVNTRKKSKKVNNKTLSIALLLPSLAKMGPVLVAYDLVKLMMERGHEVHVFYFDKKQENVLDFPCPTYNISFWRSIDFKQYDVVHSHGFRPDAYVWLHKPFRKIHTRFVTTLHNLVLEDFTATYNKIVALVFGHLWMLFIKRHDVKVVLSKVARQYYSRWFNPDKLVCIYNTRIVCTDKKLSDNEERELMQFKGKSTFLGVNAILTPRKGIDLIIKSMSFIGDCKLWIVGNGKSLENLKQLSVQEGVSDRVFFAGYRADAFRYLPYYDIYVMPSRSEGFPLALLEAAALKRNIICSDIAIFKEIFTSNEVTFFHLDNVSSLVNAVKSSWTNDKSHKSYNRYLNDYSPERFADGYENVYRGRDAGL